jgi:outer membrane lipoprotein SlyB
MNKIRLASMASALVVAGTLGACSSTDLYGPNNYPVSSVDPARTYPYGTYPAQPSAGYVEFGRVTNVTMISGGPPGYTPNRSAAGGVIGAIVGGVLGNQVGSGGGRAAATVLGATAGAVVGSNIGRNSAQTANSQYPVYRVTVQTDSGQMRTYDVNATGDLRPGDRVRIENGVIYMA